MNCEDAGNRMVERWEGQLDDAEWLKVKSHLENCPKCRAEEAALGEIWMKLENMPQEKPGEAMRERFDTMLKAYQQGMEDARGEGRAANEPVVRTKRWWPLQPVWQLAAAAVLVTVGLTSGMYLNGRSNGRSEMAELREEVTSMRQLVTLSLLRQESASARLQAVSWSRRLEQPEDEVMSALLTAMESDPNVNVRLAALDTLQRFMGQPLVKRRLTESLERQNSPLVQIGLIDLLAEQQDTDSISAIRRLTDMKGLDPVVLQRARLVTQ